VIIPISDLAFPRSAVVKPREQLLDAEVLATVADMGVEKAKKMGGATTTPAKFMTRLCRQFVVGFDPETQAETDEGAFNWTLFGSSVGKHFHEAPTMAFM
jgi:non-structural maintenance of chromosomes element 4|tara:strand:+ start:2233 stop:2532 length:300 start_codon:yes stop_codon:yes gene_type:complete